MEGSYRNRQTHHRKKGRYIEGFNGEGSWTQFLEHNPRLSLCTTDLLSRVRKNAVTASNMKNYFALLDNFALIEKTLRDNDPESIIWTNQACP